MTMVFLVVRAGHDVTALMILGQNLLGQYRQALGLHKIESASVVLS